MTDRFAMVPRRLPTAVTIATVALVVMFGWHALKIQHGTTDTIHLLDGVAVIDRCLHEHEWACGKAGFGDIVGSPVLQFIPGLIFKRTGASKPGAARDLSLLNSAAFIVLLLVLWRTGRRLGGDRMAAVLVLIGFTGPLLWYGTAGFGEGLGALFVGAFACALVTRANPLLIFITLYGAAISKEPALPFLLALAFVALRRPAAQFAGPLRRGEAVAIAFASVLSLATNIGFNAFRSTGGESGPPGLLAQSLTHPPVHGPTFSQKLESVAGLLVAPNVGVLWFWPVAVACFAVGVWGAWRAAPGVKAFAGTPAFGALVVAALLVAGVASFVAPYGFTAWGPRYLVPWVPAFAILAIYREWPRISDWMSALGRKTGILLAVGVATMAFALPQLAVFLDPGRAYAHFDPGGACPAKLTDVGVWAEAFGLDSYYRCTRYLAWTKTPVLASADAELVQWSSVAYVVVYIGAIATLIGVSTARISSGVGSARGRRREAFA